MAIKVIITREALFGIIVNKMSCKLKFWRKKKGYYKVKKLKSPKGEKGYIPVGSSLGVAFIKASNETAAMKKLTKTGLGGII